MASAGGEDIGCACGVFCEVFETRFRYLQVAFIIMRDYRLLGLCIFFPFLFRSFSSTFLYLWMSRDGFLVRGNEMEYYTD